MLVDPAAISKVMSSAIPIPCRGSLELNNPALSAHIHRSAEREKFAQCPERYRVAEIKTPQKQASQKLNMDHDSLRNSNASTGALLCDKLQ